MKTVLDIYKEVVKELGIDEDTTVSPVQKLTYVQSQTQEQRQILNRLLFDLATSVYYMNISKDALTKDAHRKKADDYRSDARQIYATLKANIELIEELRKEYPELQVGE